MEIQEKIALLIDADNANSTLIEQIISEISKYGRITVKRIYGDWTTQKNNNWKNVLNSHAIRPIQKFSYTTGKNSTDIALVIDAMDLLHSKIVDCFCIVSSDSDYTGLAQRIREEGLNIIGVGKTHTPEAFKKACITFVREENLKDNEDLEISNNSSNYKSNKAKIDYKFIDRAFDQIKDDNDVALLSKLSEAIKKLDSEFDCRTYGFKKFTEFCRNIHGYEIIKHSDNTTFSLKKLEKQNDKHSQS